MLARCRVPHPSRRLRRVGCKTLAQQGAPHLASEMWDSCREHPVLEANSQELIPHKRKCCCARLPLMPLIIILVILLLLFGGGGYYMGPGLGYYGGGGLSLVLLLVILYLLFGRGRRL